MRLWNTNVSRETFTLAEGRVSIVYPAALSSDSLRDLSDYLDIFLRKAQRLGDNDPHDFMPPKAPPPPISPFLPDHEEPTRGSA
jgi:hypothetical protein